MTGWIFVVDSAHPRHWDIAKDVGYWDTTQSRSIARGDDLFFWQAGDSLLGHLEATGPMRRLEQRDERPWEPDDARTYTHRVPMRLLSDQVISRVRWKDLQEIAGTKAGANLGIVQLTVPDGIEALRRQFVAQARDEAWPDDMTSLDFPAGLDTRERAAREIALRRGQRQFRQALLRVHGAVCAVTRSTVEPVLEAAHISPYRGDHTNQVSNGLLLRADIHTLFDLHLVTIDADDLKTRVAPTLQGSEYGEFHERPSVLAASTEIPTATRTLLQEHNEKWTSAGGLDTGI